LKKFKLEKKIAGGTEGGPEKEEGKEILEFAVPSQDFSSEKEKTKGGQLITATRE